jgi:hypothetical protein
VRLDRVAGADEHGPGRQVGLAHPEGLLHVPQVVVAADDLGRGITETGRFVTYPLLSRSRDSKGYADVTVMPGTGWSVLAGLRCRAA